jgi:hypothetical protein
MAVAPTSTTHIAKKEQRDEALLLKKTSLALKEKRAGR